jgi:hypothetical protein
VIAFVAVISLVSVVALFALRPLRSGSAGGALETAESNGAHGPGRADLVPGDVGFVITTVERAVDDPHRTSRGRVATVNDSGGIEGRERGSALEGERERDDDRESERPSPDAGASHDAGNVPGPCA